MNKIVENILLAIMLLVIIAGIAFLAIAGMNSSEFIECKKWEKQANEYERYNPKTHTGYYITKWQSEQCESKGIKIDAEVL
jgi:uncharacterized protein YxeA